MHAHTHIRTHTHTDRHTRTHVHTHTHTHRVQMCNKSSPTMRRSVGLTLLAHGEFQDDDDEACTAGFLVVRQGTERRWKLFQVSLRPASGCVRFYFR